VGNVSTMTIGCDLGDRRSDLCELDDRGNVLKRRKISTTRGGFAKAFEKRSPAVVVIEAGAHSPWISALLKEFGHEIIVANPRNLQLITKNKSKSDRVDAELLARLGRVDPRLLSPIRHRSQKAQVDLVTVRTRAELIGTRTTLVNHVRGVVKCHGSRLPTCSAACFGRKVRSFLPQDLCDALNPVLELIEQVTEQIKVLDSKIAKELPKEYPEVDVLQQVDGVGALTALTFILTIDDPHRFAKSRKVGAFLGLRPGRSQSGRSDPELRITKTGDKYLRTLLVNCAQYILGPFGKTSDLRTWGLHLAERGKKNARKRAVVAVARRLAVLLHRLWITGEVYQPCGYTISRRAA